MELGSLHETSSDINRKLACQASNSLAASLSQDCCQVYHDGRLPDTPEQLMRSRYSGYVKASSPSPQLCAADVVALPRQAKEVQHNFMCAAAALIGPVPAAGAGPMAVHCGHHPPAKPAVDG